MNQPGIFATEARKQGKSARTRGHIMDVAVSLFAQRGYDAPSINEIARQAGIANGTFYLHFKDKEELVTAVTLSIGMEMTRRIDETMVGIEDAVERVSRGTRQFIALAASEPNWGWAFFRAVTTFPQLRGQVYIHLRADLLLGVRQGAFTVPIDDFLVDAVGAILLAALLSRLSDKAGPEIGARTAELQLRMLGVEAHHAKNTAWSAIEPLRF